MWWILDRKGEGKERWRIFGGEGVGGGAGAHKEERERPVRFLQRETSRWAKCAHTPSDSTCITHTPQSQHTRTHAHTLQKAHLVCGSQMQNTSTHMGARGHGRRRARTGACNLSRTRRHTNTHMIVCVCVRAHTHTHILSPVHKHTPHILFLTHTPFLALAFLWGMSACWRERETGTRAEREKEWSKQRGGEMWEIWQASELIHKREKTCAYTRGNQK